MKKTNRIALAPYAKLFMGELRPDVLVQRGRRIGVEYRDHSPRERRIMSISGLSDIQPGGCFDELGKRLLYRPEVRPRDAGRQARQSGRGADCRTFRPGRA